MQLHEIQPTHKTASKKRVGRGGKRGTFSGRGTKGQKARAGAKIRPAERDIIKHIPKLRGYKFNSFREKPSVVNISKIDQHFKDGDTISPAVLLKAGFVRRKKGRTPRVKILGDGEIKRKYIFESVEFSKAAKEKIKAAR